MAMGGTTDHRSYNDSIAMEVNDNLDIPCRKSDLICIWFHDYDLPEMIQCRIMRNLKSIFNELKSFSDVLHLAAYLHQLNEQDFVFVFTTKDTDAKGFLDYIADQRRQCQKVYNFYPISLENDRDNLFIEIDKFCREVLKDDEICQYIAAYPSSIDLFTGNYQNFTALPAWSIWNRKSEEHSFHYEIKDSQEFFYFQLLSTTFTKFDSDFNRSLDDMFKESRLYYAGRIAQGRQVDEIAQNYQSINLIDDYISRSFLSQIVGEVFRSEDIYKIYIFRRYTFDLHTYLSQIEINRQTNQSNIIKLYRGEKLQDRVVQQLTRSLGKLISINGFLSTTSSLDIAFEVFAVDLQNPNDLRNVLFEFDFTPTEFSKVCADLSNISRFPNEVLFTVASTWQINAVEFHENNYYIIKVSSCNDFDQRTTRYFNELTHNSLCLALGDILRDLKRYKDAEKMYNKMLNEPGINDEKRYLINYILGRMHKDQGNDDKALLCFQNAERLLPQNILDINLWSPEFCYNPTESSSVFHIYNNLGCLYAKDEIDEALKYFQKALDIQNCFPNDRAKVLDNIGMIYYVKGKYDMSIQYLSQADQLATDDLSLKSNIKIHYENAIAKLSSSIPH